MRNVTCLLKSSFRLVGLLAALTGACLGSGAQAATITFGSAQNISGAADVSTSGSLLAAFGFNLGAPATVNGVNFQQFTANAGLSSTSGNYTLSVPGFQLLSQSVGSASAPYSALPAGYKAILGSGVASISGPLALDMAGLTLGRTYQFQAWVNDSRSQIPPGFTFKVDVTGGAGSVTLDPNTTLVDGGLGQFVTGTFVADSTTQAVSFFNSEVGLVNAFQLRDLGLINPPPGGPAGVPLPLAAWAGLVMGGAIVGRRVTKK